MTQILGRIAQDLAVRDSPISDVVSSSVSSEALPGLSLSF